MAKLNPDLSQLLYSTYLGGYGLGGSYGDGNDSGCGIAVDGNGHVYVTGAATPGFPTTPGAYDTTYNGGSEDMFVTELNPSLSGTASLIYSTFVGGTKDEHGIDIAVDGNGFVYVTGHTKSSDFPTTPNAYQPAISYSSGEDAFVMKLKLDTTLSPAGQLVYSTYLGGAGRSVGGGIAVDGYGKIYVTGFTQASNFPTTVGAYDAIINMPGANPNLDAFVAVLDPAAPTGPASLVYSTFLGGSRADEGAGIAVDGSGFVYVTGYTTSADFPTTPGAYDAIGGVTPLLADAFVVKLKPDTTLLPAASQLVYSTYLGGAGNDIGTGIVLDRCGNVYVTGRTMGDFPTTADAYQTSYAGGAYDAFVAGFNPNGTQLLYSTYLGGAGEDWGNGIAINRNGSVYVTGHTTSTSNLPTVGAYQTTSGGGQDAFVARFDLTTCTTLTVNKVLLPATDPGLFNLQIMDGATTVATATAGNGGTTGVVPVTAGVTYTVGETAMPGTNLANYASVIGGDCNPANGTITLAAGENKTCTFTNTIAPTATLTIVKDAVPNDAQDFNFFAFGPNSGSIPPFKLDDDAGALGEDTTLSSSKTFSNLVPGDYGITEDFYNPVVTGWDLAGIICTTPNGTPVGTVDLAIHAFMVNLAAGDNVTCTFTNVPQPTTDGADLVVTKTCALDPAHGPQAVYCAVTVHNNGPLASGSPITVTDMPFSPPPGTVFTSSSGSFGCTQAAGPVPASMVCTYYGSIGNGQDGTTFFYFNVPQGGEFANCASASQGGSVVDPNPANNTDLCARVTVPAPTPRTGSICGMKFNDLDGNGVYDPPGEQGLPNWTISLGISGIPDVTTGADGRYCFKDVPAGTYTVSEILQSGSGWQQTFPVNPGTHTVTLAEGVNITGINFGNMVPAYCSQVDFCNGDFEQILNGQAPATYVQTSQANIPCWQTTAADGNIEIWHAGYGEIPAYSGTYFAELNGTQVGTLSHTFSAPAANQQVMVSFAHRGRYAGDDVMEVSIVPPSGSGLPTTLLGTGTYTDNNTAWRYYSVPYTIPVPGTYTLKFKSISSDSGKGPSDGGNFLDAISVACPPSLSGIKFNDLNGNGHQDPGELGIPNWHFSVGIPGIPDVATGADGQYGFNNLPAGTYTVSEAPQAPWQQTFPSSPGTHTVTLATGQILSGLNFGNRVKPGSCTGFCNGDFEDTQVLSPGSAGSVGRFDQSLISCWQTTISDGKIDVWHGGTGTNMRPGFSGNQFVEIPGGNAPTNYLYQDFNSGAGGPVIISFAHMQGPFASFGTTFSKLKFRKWRRTRGQRCDG